MIENRQWAAPSLEQMAELQQGLVPREFVDEANLTPQALRIYNSASSIPQLWPTARGSDGEKGSPNQAGRKGDLMLPSAVVAMVEGNWATPMSRDYRSGEAPTLYDYNARPLNEQVLAWTERDAGQWATPNALTSNDGETPATWRARQARLKLKGYNGNGAGVPLAIQAQEQCLSFPPAHAPRAGSPSPTTDPTSSPPSPPTDESPTAAPTTPSTSRGGSLVRLNPAFVAWLMAGLEGTDWGHACRTTATALARTA